MTQSAIAAIKASVRRLDEIIAISNDHITVFGHTDIGRRYAKINKRYQTELAGLREALKIVEGSRQ